MLQGPERVRNCLFGVLLLPCLALLMPSCTQRWCGSWNNPTLLCDDFDENSSTNQEGVPFLSTQGAGGDFAVSANSYTPPNSVLGTSNPFSGEGGAGVTLAGGFWASPHPVPPVVTCQVQIQPQALSSTPGDGALIFTLSFMDGASRNPGALSLLTDSLGNLFFVESYSTVDGGVGAPVLHPLGQAISLGNFSLFELILTNQGPATYFSVAANGEPPTNGTLQQPLPATLTMATSLGPIDLGAASTGWQMLYDDLICY